MMQTFRTRETNYPFRRPAQPRRTAPPPPAAKFYRALPLPQLTQRQLRFDLGGSKAVMPFGQCADGAESGTVRDIAVLTRVGRRHLAL